MSLRPPSFLLVLSAAGCTAPSLPETSETSDTPPGAPAGTEAEEVGAWPRACADVYDPATLGEIDLEFEPADWAAISADLAAGVKRYHPVQIHYGNETVPALVRLKGNWSWSTDKMQFLIAFDEDGGRFHGLRKLSLDAPWYDRTLLHERLAFPLFAALGLPSSCVNHLRVNIDGVYYGVYSNTERIDREYLERNFAEPDGNLYEAWNELETNESTADTSRLNDLKNAQTVDQLATLVDLDQAVSEWAVEAMIPASDNYWAGVEINYYLYDHPSRGFLWLPYDLDAAFGDSAYSDGSLVYPDAVTADPITWENDYWLKEPLVKIVLADPTWCGRFADAVRRARAQFDPKELTTRIDTWDNQIAEALAEDPHRTCSLDQHAAAVEELRAFVVARAAFVDEWLAVGSECPARW